METSIKERNERAFKIMRERRNEQMSKDVGMSLKDLIEFTQVVQDFSEWRYVNNEFLAQFLICGIDWSNHGEKENIIPRYKSYALGGWENIKRDWDNRLEMGK